MNYLSQIKLSKKLNIYPISLGFIYRKLLWDFNWASYISRGRLKKMKNKYVNKKLLILCNGPSLNKVNFDEIKNKNIVTIGLNKINLLFESTDFRPDMIVSVNKLVIEQNKRFFNDTSIDLILDSSSAKFISQRKNVNFIYSLPYQLKFAGDITGAVCQGYTVTYVALQVAFHLGFKKVALVGCDHNFATKGSPNMTIKSNEIDLNHFSTKYFSGTDLWQLPDLLGSEMHYKLAKEYFEANNREIFNCTEGGKLEIFKRKKLIDFLNE